MSTEIHASAVVVTILLAISATTTLKNEQLTAKENANHQTLPFPWQIFTHEGRLDEMSLERVLNTFKSFGLKPSDAQVYVFLAKKGSHTGKDLSNALRIPQEQLHQCLKDLENKGIINASSENLLLFSALPFEKIVDLLVKTKLEEARRTQQEKDEALSNWQSMIKETSTEQ